MLTSANVPFLDARANGIKIVKNLGKNIAFPNQNKGPNTVSIAVFGDAGRLSYHGQLCYITGLLIGTLAINSAFYSLSWVSQKSRRPV